MDPFVAEIRIFPFNFAPRGWAFCNGQLVPIAQNTALFSLLGTTYGGNGQTTFGLPNLQGSAPMHPGQGPGLTQHNLGEMGGTETVTLLETEMPVHSHSMKAYNSNGTLASPANNVSSGPSPVTDKDLFSYKNGPPNVTMKADTLGTIGGGLPHNNLMPYLTMNFCIALQGVYPPRN
jgi:microcystin-dependent protein